MSTAPSSIELAFPHQTLTKIEGIPDAASIGTLKKQVCANAHAIPALQGGGISGHLGAVMDDHTKHFPASVHQSIRPTRVRDLPQNANFLLLSPTATLTATVTTTASMNTAQCWLLSPLTAAIAPLALPQLVRVC